MAGWGRAPSGSMTTTLFVLALLLLVGALLRLIGWVLGWGLRLLLLALLAVGLMLVFGPRADRAPGFPSPPDGSGTPPSTRLAPSP